MSKIKKMQEAEYDKMFELAQYAFQLETSSAYQERFHYLAQHSVNYGSFEGEALASQVMLTPFKVHFFNQVHLMAGIGFVSSDPSFRGGGRIDEIMRQILVDCHEQGILFSYLAPFSYPFYRRYGYELLFEKIAYRIPSQEWQIGLKVEGSVSKENWPQAKVAIKQIYQTMMESRPGSLVREDWWYDYKFDHHRQNYFAIYYDTKQQAQGYLVYQIKAGVFTCVEWLYQTFDAYAGLNRYIASHMDSVNEFYYEQGFDRQTPFATTPIPLRQAQIRPEMMARIVDFEAFFKLFPFENLAQSFAVVIAEDLYAPWNQGVYEIRKEEQAAVTVQKVTKTSLLQITGSIQAYTQLFLGYQSIENLLFLNKVQVEKELIPIINQILPKETPVLEDYF